MSEPPREDAVSTEPSTVPAPAPVTDRDRSHRRLSPLTPVVRGSLLLLAFLGTSWDDLLRRDIGPTALVLLAVLVAGAVYGAAAWWRTKYWVEAGELRVDTGVLVRQSRRIRVDRLQGIEIVQPVVARLLGLAEITMDVVGGGPGEGSLAYLPLREARQLRELLLARRDDVAPAALGNEARPGAAVGHEGRVVARLDLGTLLLSMLLSFETIVFAVASLVAVTGMVVTGELVGAAGLVPVVAAFALTQLRKLSAFYDFTVLEVPAGFQVRRGLFERNSQTIAVSRVQGLVVAEPLLWRRLGWARLDVSVVGSGPSSEGQGGPAPSTVMPVAPMPAVLALAGRLLEASVPVDRTTHADVPLSPSPRRARWLAPVWWRFASVGLGTHLAVSRVGLLTRRTHVVPHARVQSVHVHQGPLLRRLGLADLVVDSPPGPVQVRGRRRTEVDARTLLAEADDLSRVARHPPRPAVPDLSAPPAWR